MKAKIAHGLMPLVVLCALPVQALAQGQDRQPLQPSSKWVVDYADSECRLSRTFGIGENAVTLRLARGGSLTSYDVVLAGPALPKLSSEISVTMALEPAGAEVKSSGYSMMVPGQSFRFVRWYDADPAIFDQWSNAQVVKVSMGDRTKVRLNVLDGKKALAALAACHDDLLQGWKVDVAGLRALTSLPEPSGDSAKWVNSADYPAGAIQDGIDGTVRTQLMVAPNGRATDCKVIGSSRNLSLDSLTCEILLRRARFKPAIRKDGTAVSAPYFRTV